MKSEGPKMPSPEEAAKIQAERTLSDAEFIKAGAEYSRDGVLELDERQKSFAEREMNSDLYRRESIKKYESSDGAERAIYDAYRGIFRLNQEISKLEKSGLRDELTQLEICVRHLQTRIWRISEHTSLKGSKSVAELFDVAAFAEQANLIIKGERPIPGELSYED